MSWASMSLEDDTHTQIEYDKFQHPFFAPSGALGETVCLCVSV